MTDPEFKKRFGEFFADILTVPSGLSDFGPFSKRTARFLLAEIERLGTAKEAEDIYLNGYRCAVEETQDLFQSFLSLVEEKSR